jgi:hypothetical protein
MSDLTFREPQPEAKEPEVQAKANVAVSLVNDVPVPYTSYDQEKGQPLGESCHSQSAI